MGSTFQQPINPNHSQQRFLDRCEKLFDDSIKGFSVNASLPTKRCFTNLKGKEAQDRSAERALKFCAFPECRGANVLLFSTKPRERNRSTYRTKRTPQWRCSDTGATETSPSSVSLEIVGLGPKGDSAVVAPAEEVPLALRVSIDIDNRYAEETNSGIRGVHIVDSEPAESREGRATGCQSQISIEAPLSVDTSTLTETEWKLPIGKNEKTQPGAPSAQPSDYAATGAEYELADTPRSDGVDMQQSVEWAAFCQVQEDVPSSVANNGVLEIFNEDIQPHNGLLQQVRDIILFAGPALGIWLSGPMMSLIDTAVVGNRSSLELAALGPGTVFCDQLGYVFMFLSVATSNLIATALAKEDESKVGHHLSRLLFVSLACGIGMFLLTFTFSKQILKAFIGPQNEGLLPAANAYVQIRGLAWPAVLVGMVAQSASLGMQDSWSPFKVLAVSSTVNFVGDILLCTCLGYGISGAAWATMLSQYIGGYLMLRSLYKKGYNPLVLCVPSARELLLMIEIAAPVLLTMLSKVSFYALITFLSTSLGPVVLAAHQVMIGIYSTCTVSGEPLAQTAQSFMPSLIQGANINLQKAKALLRSLLLIGGLAGTCLGCFALGFPWVFPQVFTHDKAIIHQMQVVTLPFLCALVITPPLLSLEGTLLAGRDLKFLSLSMVSCFMSGAVLLMVFKELGFGLQGFWWILASFQSSRFIIAAARLRSAKSVLKGPIPLAAQSFPHSKAT